MKKQILISIASSLLAHSAYAFTVSSPRSTRPSRKYSVATNVDGTTVPTKTATKSEYSFIQTELRGAAMKLHTKQQSPKEGGVVEDTSKTQLRETYITTHLDYLSFLVDSQHVYKAMEDIVQQYDELQPFRNTGLERVAPLDTDIQYMILEYNLQRPDVGTPGREYAKLLHEVASTSVPAFMCHYYNYYFAHTAGGRMIGKQMSALLLNKKTLEFYKVIMLRILVVRRFRIC
jgi:heme oxygenase (biliverdin-producing, ferredoxin)